MRSLVSIYVDRKKEALYNYTKLMLEGNREVIKNGKTEIQAEELCF